MSFHSKVCNPLKTILPGLLLVLTYSTQLSAQRATGGLLALYNFDETEGKIIKDHSGVEPAMDLEIENLKAVSRSDGILRVHGETRILSRNAATKIQEALRQSGEITVEAWIHPANTTQSGPARILTISKNISERNFTLGQNGNKLDARLRTTRTSKNGMPSTLSRGGSLKAELTHVVYSRKRDGETRIYINGRQAAQKTIAGEPSNWDGSFRLALTNEVSLKRPWKGSYHLIAFYGRNLSGSEIEQNFKAGANAGSEQFLARLRIADNARRFHREIAPLLVKHCLECHDAATSKGKLDLSHKASAMAGGKEGKAIIPGKGHESLLWQMVADNEMPEDRDPLSAVQKEALKKWIDNGAHWRWTLLTRLPTNPMPMQERHLSGGLRFLNISRQCGQPRGWISPGRPVSCCLPICVPTGSATPPTTWG